ncbi:MAG TPA: chromate efflux transporter [Planctomycetota bacterium]|nr:chromate efflux transporter [Planctomycetota bacterium]
MPEPGPSLRPLLRYLLWLGATGFGGPIALVGYMQRDLVERRGWFSQQDYREGLALAQAAPGPLAAQLAIYLGWLRGGLAGATLAGLAFVLPSLLMVLLLSWLYLRFGGLDWMQGAFYGIGAAVIAIIARSAFKLAKTTLGKERLLDVVCVGNAVAVAWTESELVWVFVASALLVWVVRCRPMTGAAALAPLVPFGSCGTFGSAVDWLWTGLHGPADGATFAHIAWFFSAAGAFVFGSGLAIVPFLHGGVVHDFGWLSERQFLDAVAVAMITPGPVVITVAFVGYLAAGPLGGVLAALGTFLPCWLFVVVPAGWFRRNADNRHLRAVVDGLTAAATGAIAGAAFVLGRRALVDLPTWLIAIAVMAAVIWVRKVPEPLWILAAGVVGFLLRP